MWPYLFLEYCRNISVRSEIADEDITFVVRRQLHGYQGVQILAALVE
jgi:hypothetical protein